VVEDLARRQALAGDEHVALIVLDEQHFDGSDGFL